MSSATEGSNTQEKYKQVILGPSPVSIPEYWDVATLGEITTIVSGSTPKKSNEEYWGEEIVWVTPTDVTSLNGKYLYDSEEKITEAGLNNSSATMIEPGAVLMTSRATIGEVVINKVPVTTNQGFKTLVPNEVIDAEYLYYYLPSIKQYLNAIGGGSTFSEISKTDVSGIKIPIPSLPEQRQIANILSTVDEQIQQTEDTIKKVQEIKKGVMRDLLKKGIDHTQYKEMYIGPKRSTIPQDWDIVALDEIADIQSGSTPKRSNDDYWYEGTIPWIKSGEFNDGVIYEAEEKITQKALDESGCTVFPEGTLMLALYGKGTVSKTARLGLDAATNQAIAGILPEEGKFDPVFLQYYLINARNTLLNVTVNPSSDAARTNIYMGALRQFKIALPPIEEQKKIAERLLAVDEKINREKETKQELKNLKRGLMQDLLSGTKRVDPEMAD